MKWIGVQTLPLPEKVQTCLLVFYCMKGGKLLNVSHSTISYQDKKLTDANLYQKWKSINWHQVEKSVNKLQTRITKAVVQNKWNLVKRLLTPESKIKAVLILTGKRYKAKPLKRVFINKPGKKKKRPLGIPTMYDRAMQSLYSLALEPIAETKSDIRSFGFR